VKLREIGWCVFREDPPEEVRGREQFTSLVQVAGDDDGTVLGEYTDHYNCHRPHRALLQDPPSGHPHPPAPSADVRVLRRDRLGGLIDEYSQVA
jgi:putative transposase